MNLPLDSIRFGERVRKDMGDIAGLAQSIESRGLLQPIVVLPDNTLVIGSRRIEATRLLGRESIEAMVVDVDDLLSAERDENFQRKAFTPVEALAIGRLLEKRHKTKIAEIRGAQMSRAGKLSAAKNLGTTYVEVEDVQPLGSTDQVVATALGMSSKRYFYAKKVAAAAEASPEKYGDILQRMDETGNVNGAYTELQRRLHPNGKTSQGGTSRAARHPVHSKKRIPKPEKMLAKAVGALEGTCVALNDIADSDLSDIDKSTASELAASFEALASQIRKFARRLKA